MPAVRQAIHAGRKIALAYCDEQGRESRRTVWPFAIGYHQTTRVLVAWCELRGDFRSFRTDRVVAAEFLETRYPERPAVLRARWRKRREAFWAARNKETAVAGHAELLPRPPARGFG